MITKNSTPCCALNILSINNEEKLDNIKNTVEKFKETAFSKDWKKSMVQGGQRNIMVICSPGETNLEENLRTLGFNLLTDKMPRRNGYPEGLLKLFMLSF